MRLRVFYFVGKGVKIRVWLTSASTIALIALQSSGTARTPLLIIAMFSRVEQN
ncbi:MAG TPA: hypothetical protein VNN76_12435 [Bacteroidota bacterium]|nr:hypothetical protein [Bacteroidota bacterium]